MSAGMSGDVRWDVRGCPQGCLGVSGLHHPLKNAKMEALSKVRKTDLLPALHFSHSLVHLNLLWSDFICLKRSFFAASYRTMLKNIRGAQAVENLVGAVKMLMGLRRDALGVPKAHLSIVGTRAPI